MPHLETYMGPGLLVPQILPNQKVRRLGLIEPILLPQMQGLFPSEGELKKIITSLKELPEDLRANIRVLDIVQLLTISQEHNPTMATLFLNVEVVAVIGDAKTPTESIFVPYLDAFAIFRQLKMLHIFCGPRLTQAVIELLPKPCYHHPSPLLTELHVMGICTGRWDPKNGWIYYPESKETKLASRK
ncbi:hypothetical protein M422DRAFT_260374 [Sphaerobolus stellatus SS14]|uniref:Unplaced genomic scaffold SPHSTscaffold_96, whole genome shotgun sequence n=1 Tax=Sphaerobolus stellatus (strain SS14) TaxID=990650 RepID=A0A0C9VIQ5_SPHS4|nr:hypothetical protein M422DRAFT_260374 [Sphaerobolus stellatus SS14]